MSKSKPVSKIPDFVHGMMNKDVEKNLDKFVQQEYEKWSAAERKKHQIEVTGPGGAMPSTPAPIPAQPTEPVIPPTPKIQMIAVDGEVLSSDTVTMMLYALVTLARKDKKLAKLLRTFKFKMKNVNGEVIWE